MSFLIASFLLVFASFGNEKLATSNCYFLTFKHNMIVVTKTGKKIKLIYKFYFLIFQKC